MVCTHSYFEYHQLEYRLQIKKFELDEFSNVFANLPVSTRSKRRKKCDTVLHMNFTYGTLFILMFRGREKKIHIGGQTTMAKNKRTSFKLFPVQLKPPLHNSLRYDWTYSALKLLVSVKVSDWLTAAFETTVFWSHSMRTSRKVALFRSIAWSTFPKRKTSESNSRKS